VKLSSTVQDLWAGLQDLLFPQRCVSCGQIGSLLCDECQQKIDPVSPPWCPLCGYPAKDNHLCQRCRHSPLALDGIRSVAFFEGPLRKAMHALKYRGLRAVAAPLGGLMAAYWRRNPLPADLIVPVPLHRHRERTRGYNQADLLALALADQIDLPVCDDWLIRTHNTSPQIDLDAEARKMNVAGAFRARENETLVGRRVLLIDDVCTTGATLEACSVPLRQAGAGSVWAFTLGRAR
jgi:ComF family protein